MKRDEGSLNHCVRFSHLVLYTVCPITFMYVSKHLIKKNIIWKTKIAWRQKEIPTKYNEKTKHVRHPTAHGDILLPELMQSVMLRKHAR